MFYNNFVSGPNKPANYSQPNVANPVANPAVGKVLPPPATVVSSTKPYVQPNSQNPAANPAVGVMTTKNGNPMDIIFPVAKNNNDANAELLGATGRGPVAACIPPVLHNPYSSIPGN
jgi:hypothetical protein